MPINFIHFRQRNNLFRLRDPVKRVRHDVLGNSLERRPAQSRGQLCREHHHCSGIQIQNTQSFKSVGESRKPNS